MSFRGNYYGYVEFDGDKMRKHGEDARQAALITWCTGAKLPALPWIEPNATVIDYLYAIPSDGRYNPKGVVRLTKQGVKSSISDLHLALPMSGKHGLWIKKTKASVSLLQGEWLIHMDNAGFDTVICFGWEEVKQAIIEYISFDEPLKVG